MANSISTFYTTVISKQLNNVFIYLPFYQIILFIKKLIFFLGVYFLTAVTFNYLTFRFLEKLIVESFYYCSYSLIDGAFRLFF